LAPGRSNFVHMRKTGPVATWLLVGVFMIIVQIVLGGITRLTDSGLSITEWKPLLGTIPPLNEKQWNEAFSHYKEIAQFKHLHSYFTLEDFKSIFFWEWLHRLWGRLIGVVFAIPFVIFLLQKRFTASMIRPMIILFLLGGLQGLVGWIMVKSGLNDENLYVSHIRLAIHFIAALVLLVYTVWFALKLIVPAENRISNAALKKFTWILIGVLTLQLIYGAFMAGLKAAPSAPTWPSINGEYFPANMQQYRGEPYSFFSSVINNPITVHFIHRNLAYLFLILIIAWTIKAFKIKDAGFRRIILWPLVLTLLQVALGIFTVLASPLKIPQHWGRFEWFAQLHQVIAILLLLSLVIAAFYCRRKSIVILTDPNPQVI
jgi:heme a synthase